MMRWTAQALEEVLQPAKVHFGIYAESVKHLHVHVFPRMPDMPAGNIPNMWIGRWVDFLQSLGLKKAYPDEVVARYAEPLRGAYLKLAGKH
jgi:diadenosine tetraphosphate (Ap4A) HIT family hydrolase